jgi:hypothetical protein
MAEYMKKFGVYFIYCKNSWKDIFDEQINDIYQSNILKNIDKLFLSIYYTNDSDLEYIKTKTNNDKICIANSYNKNYYEFEALRVVKEIAKKYTCNIFYMHTKGAGICEENKTFYHGSTDLNYLLRCVRDWRRFMESYILFNSNKVDEILKIYDACGANLCDSPSLHYSGNFWWSTSEHIRKLSLDNCGKKTRWDAEFWLGLNGGNFYNFETNKQAGYIHLLK